MNNHKKISRWIGCCLMLVTTLCFINDSIAAGNKKKKRLISSRSLLIKIQERDAIIADLMTRVDMLEKRLGGGSTLSLKQEDFAPSPPVNAVGKPAEKSNNPAPSQTAKAEAPGEFKVDEQASQRALERTLAKSGVLLLPTWYLDTDVNFNYTYRDSPTSVTLYDSQGNSIGNAPASARRNIFEPSIAFRLGLPFDAQFEFSLPYRFANQSTVVQNLSGDSKSNDSALGDVQIGLAKTILKEAQWWPDLVARVTWDTGSGTGGSGNSGLLGQGIQSVTGSLSMLKRQDPLAFFFNAGYTRSFTERHYFSDGSSYNPGNTIAFSFGTQLAASADTSLSFALNELFVSNSEQNSQTIAGSNRNIGLLSIGASSIISRNMFVNLSVGMGLTSDSPDYTAGITFSNRINLSPYLGIK